MKFLEQRNPNADALVVPQEEGGTEDDNYFGSIGDATMRHVQSLSLGERQLWEELIHMGSGAIFRPTPSLDYVDNDPFKLRGQDLDEALKEYQGKVAPDTLQAIKEAFEQEATRRESSEDALDHEIVPYHEWEENPQMWNAIDIPSTPRDKMIYQGNTSQPFYDNFPEGHQNQDFVNRVLRCLDRDWAGGEEDEGYAGWVVNEVIAPANAKTYVKRLLEQLVMKLATGDHDSNDLIDEYLKKIDDEWGYRYREFAKKKLLETDEMVQVLRMNAKQWQQRHKNGEPVFKDIKEFGSNVWKDPELRGKMSGTAWAMYKRIKGKFCPPVQFRGKDLNRCSVGDLRNILGVSDQEARAIWFDRPFESLHSLRYKGYISGKTFATSEEAAKLIDGMEKKALECVRDSNMAGLIKVRQKLNAMQSSGKPELSASQWKLLWDYYKILKNDVLRAMKNGGQKEGEAHV